MKKMIVMMAFATMVVAANAATVTWAAAGLKEALPGGAFSATSLSGAVAYLFYGAQDHAALVSAIEGKTFTGAGNLSSALTTSSGGITKAGIGNYSNQDVTLYMVVFNAATIAGSTYYMISTDYTQTFTTANKTYNFTTAPTHMPSSWTAVPEPTSMALLALGVAAVGLRRRFTK